MPKYITITGHNYKPEGAKEEKRVDAGGEVSDMPKASLKNELAAGKVEEVKEEKPQAAEKVEE